MKIIQIDENTLSVKTTLGRLDIKDNLVNKTQGRAVAIAINVIDGVEIKGKEGRLIILQQKRRIGK